MAITTAPAPASASATEPEAPAARRLAGRRRLSPGRALAWVYLAVVVLITVFPFAWMLRTALSDNFALIQNPASLLPVDFTWGPFGRVLGLQSAADAQAEGGSGVSVNLGGFVVNSVIYAGVATLCQVFFATLAAYAFSRLQWKGRDLVFGILFSALMIPGILTLLPNFVTIKELGLLDSFAGLILPGALFSAFNIFFLRQFFLGMNSEIEEAAMLDGASRLRILFRITIPLASGPITTISILGFITYWNDYFWPLLVANDESVQPLTLALGVFKQSSPQAQPDWAGLMAAALLAALPMLLVFLVFGRRIVNSLGFSGVK
ncbi:carbohydrate ABC transporter permease [Arenivirga flava]|uniref:Sugar ABC transporter permease n=1 Tax=Arenivirga flava TaxID=1930060 RepID=A0AA37XBE8_9MICO|nr:carbohydrate ABC transporter permease [Arenivirga flava]GMA28561.1 sugar ABC transporter permease [Arenivirga flava]